MRLSELTIMESKEAMRLIPEGKKLINTINAHSFNIAQKDCLFAEALTKGDYLIPDGSSIVMACKYLRAKSQPKERIAGWNLFMFEMQRLDSKSAMRKATERKPRVMFVGSSEKVLENIKKRAMTDFQNLEIVTYSPPFKSVFTEEDNANIICSINKANPDLLWIGMTAPKQEKWTYQHWNEIKINCHVGTIGAVFDFYAGTVKRAPLWWQNHALEWLYRLLNEPKRMWKRYIIGNPLFIWYIMREL